MLDKSGYNPALKDRYGKPAGPPKALKPKRAKENNSLRDSMRRVAKRTKLM